MNGGDERLTVSLWIVFNCHICNVSKDVFSAHWSRFPEKTKKELRKNYHRRLQKSANADYLMSSSEKIIHCGEVVSVGKSILWKRKFRTEEITRIHQIYFWSLQKRLLISNIEICMSCWAF